MLARLVTAVLTVAIPLVLARAMRMEDYGTYKQLLLISQTLWYVLPFGVPQSLYFFIPRAEQKRPFFCQTMIFVTAAGVVVALFLHAFMGELGVRFHNAALTDFRTPLGVYTACLLAGFPLEIALTSQGKTKLSAISYLVSDSTRALVMTLPILLGFGLHGMVNTMAAFAVCRFIAAWTVSLKTEGPLFDKRLFRQQLAYAAPFGLAMAVAIPQQYAHQYAVSAVVTPALFAIYAVGCFQLPLVDLLYTPTSEVLMVRIGELEKEGRVEEAVHAFKEASGKLAYVFLPLAAFLIAVAPEFITAAFGARFLAAVPIFRVSVVGVALATFPMDGVLRARNETRHILISYVVKALATAPLLYFGVKHFGMMGGIGAWVIAEVIGKGTLMLQVPRALSTEKVRHTFKDVLPGRELGRALLGAGLAALGVVIARDLSPIAWSKPLSGFFWHLVPLAGAGLLFAATYFASLRLTGVRPTAVLATFWRRRVEA